MTSEVTGGLIDTIEEMIEGMLDSVGSDMTFIIWIGIVFIANLLFKIALKTYRYNRIRTVEDLERRTQRIKREHRKEVKSILDDFEVDIKPEEKGLEEEIFSFQEELKKR